MRDFRKTGVQLADRAEFENGKVNLKILQQDICRRSGTAAVPAVAMFTLDDYFFLMRCLYRLLRLQITVALFMAFQVNADDGEGEGLRVTNHVTGSSVDYSVILLRGTVEAEATSLDIKHSKPVKPAVHRGSFKALVELAKGKNRIELQSDMSKNLLVLDITYEPQTNPYSLLSGSHGMNWL